MDLLFGEEGDDVLFGYNNSDTLDGGSGHDVLQGFDGNDLLIGNLGFDSLTSNIGNDIFVLADDDGIDFFTDFTVGQDVIGLTETLSVEDIQVDVLFGGASPPTYSWLFRQHRWASRRNKLPLLVEIRQN